jgi:HEAT repeat protein
MASSVVRLLATVFIRAGGLHSVARSILIHILDEEENLDSVRVEAADFLGLYDEPTELTVAALKSGLLDVDNDVRSACARALAILGRRFPEAFDSIKALLLAVISDANFEARDRYENRTGNDYAFDGLWMLMAGEGS